jgi:hypothetical protein
MNKRIKNLFCLSLFLLSGITTYAQTAVIKASIDSTQILIGEQTKIHVEIAADKNSELRLPLPLDTLTQGIEVLEISKIDTTDIGNNRIRLNYDFLVTSFDSALYLLPPLVLIAGNDTSYSNDLALKVSTFPVDTESEKFYDIKNVTTPQIVLLDYINYIIYPIGAFILIAAIVLLIYGLSTKKALISFKKEEPVLPPHLIAISELDKIKAGKLWQQGKTKEYHSKITDTLRLYMERRFDIPAMEFTSGEILSKVRNISEVDYVYDQLKQILILADFVKFAKYQPLPDENEWSLMNAYLFVNGTKKEEIPLEKGKNENVENLEK